jgi:hypothetical protein
LDLEEVDLPLEAGDLFFELDSPVLDRGVPLSESSGVDLVGQVELVDLIGFGLETHCLPPQGVEKLFLGSYLLVANFERRGDLLRGEEEGFELLLKDPLQVHLGHLVPAGLADVLRRVRGHVHPAAAVAEGQAREEVDRPAGRPRLSPPLLGEESVRRVPDLLGHHRLHLGGHPLMGRLQVPALALAPALRVVGAPFALRGRVADQALDGRIRELAAASRAIAALREDAGHREEPAVRKVEFIHEAPDRGFLRVRDEPLLVPAVAEGRSPSQGLAELRAYRDRGGHAARDLLPLPGGHAGDHGVEEAAGRGRGVYGLLKGNEIGTLRLEELGELQKLPGVARQARDLREDEARDAMGLHVLHHAARFGVREDRFPGDAGQVIEGHDFPPADLGVGAGAVLVVLGAFAPRLVFGRDPDPDRYALPQFLARRLDGCLPLLSWHSLLRYRVSDLPQVLDYRWLPFAKPLGELVENCVDRLHEW